MMVNCQKWIFYAILCVLFIFENINCNQVIADHVHRLDNFTFDTVTRINNQTSAEQNQKWLIIFGSYDQVSPEYIRAAQELHGKVLVGYLNCFKSKMICDRLLILSSPRIFLFYQNQMYEFTQASITENLVSFAMSNYKNKTPKPINSEFSTYKFYVQHVRRIIFCIYQYFKENPLWATINVFTTLLIVIAIIYLSFFWFVEYLEMEFCRQNLKNKGE